MLSTHPASRARRFTTSRYDPSPVPACVPPLLYFVFARVLFVSSERFACTGLAFARIDLYGGMVKHARATATLLEADVGSIGGRHRCRHLSGTRAP